MRRRRLGANDRLGGRPRTHQSDELTQLRAAAFEAAASISSNRCTVDSLGDQIKTKRAQVTCALYEGPSNSSRKVPARRSGSATALCGDVLHVARVGAGPNNPAA